MANKKIKKVDLNGEIYDIAVDGVDKVEGLEERLAELHSVDGNTLVIGENTDTPEPPGYADQTLTSVLVGGVLYPIKDTKYTHPTYTSNAEGLYKVAVDGTGHVSKATAVTKTDITNLGIPAQDTTYTSKSAASGGTAVSLVTTGEKYTWNNKQAAISDLATIRSNASTGATHAGSTHARTDATKVEDSTTNGNIKINGTETNVYTHPAYTSKAEGLYKVTVDNTGHISAATAVTKTDITNLGIPGSNTNTTYDLAAAKSKTNGSVTLDLTAGGSGSGTDSVTIKGTGATTVTTDANGVITINSTDNNTVYTHPTHTSKASGLYKVTVDGTGHVSAATAVTKSDITSLGIPGSDTNTTYTIETGDSNGQIKVTPSSGDAYNVDVKGLGSAAYTNSSAYMPAGDTSHGTHVSAATVKSALGTGTGTSKYLREDGAWVTPPNTTYSNATTSTAGLMSSTDKRNLNNLVTAWSADGTDDTLINKVQEVLDAFKNTPEGTDIVESLAGKSKVGHTHGTSTKNVAPSGHTHTVTVSGTTGNNSGSAVKAVTGYGSFSGGSGSASFSVYSSDTTTTADTIASSGRIPYISAASHTAASLGTASTGTVSISGGSYSGTTKYMKVSTTAANTGTVGISGGSGSLVAYDASTGGNAKTTNGNRIPFITSLSKSGYTPAGSVSLTDGTAPSMGAATTKYLHFSAGTTPPKSASFSGTAVTSGAASTTTTSSAGANTSKTSNTGDAGSTTIASVSGGVLTISNVANHNHTYYAPVAHTHTLSHTHSVTAAGTVTLTDGTAPSLTANTTASGGIQYVHSQGTFSAGTTPKSSASFTGTNSTAVVTGGTTYHLAHGHTGASLTGTTTFNTNAIKSVTLSASTTSTDGPAYTESISGSAPSLGGTKTFVTGYPNFSGGSGSHTTKYLKLNHTHTGASLGTASTADAAPHTHTHSYGSSTALTTGTNSGTAVAAVTEVEASAE